MFPQIFGKYVLEREIAEGGMARVFLATLRGAGGFEKRLVVKQIRSEFVSDEAFVRRFVAEAKTAVELSHPNIVPVYELGVEQGIYFIAMELCEGATLAEILGETGALSPLEGAYLGAEVCRALDFAHRRAQVIHRDVTPRNVMIDEEGAVRLIDFGIAAPVTHASSHRKKYEIFGSPGHMPPEQLAGGKLTPASDVFAVATVLTEAWTGKPVFRRTTAHDSKLALREAPVPLEQQVEELAPLAPVVAAALSSDPERRPAAAEQLARPLREFLNGHDVQDIARLLGEKVEVTRQRLAQKRASQHPPVAVGAVGVGSRGGSTGGSVKTHTFALSSQAEEWTRGEAADRESVGGVNSAPVEPAEYHTRRLTPLPGDSQPPADERPLAAKRPAIDAEQQNAPRRVRSGQLLVWAVAIILLGLAGWMGWRSKQIGRAQLAAPAVLAGDASRAGSVAPREGDEQAPPVSAGGDRWRERGQSGSFGASEPRVKDGTALPAVALTPGAAEFRAKPPVTHTRPEAEPVASTESDGLVEAKADRTHAFLSLTSVPQSSVTVGAKALTTPVQSLELSAGSHRVTFRNQTWEGPVSTQLSLAEGESKRVHADFTTDPPRVIVR